MTEETHTPRAEKKPTYSTMGYTVLDSARNLVAIALPSVGETPESIALAKEIADALNKMEAYPAMLEALRAWQFWDEVNNGSRSDEHHKADALRDALDQTAAALTLATAKGVES